MSNTTNSTAPFPDYEKMICDHWDKLNEEVFIQPNEYPTSVYVHKLEQGEIFFPPYQRDFIWDAVKQSRFIESILLDYPSPNIFMFEDEDGRLEVADGLQRITTLKRWMGGSLSLTGLTELTFLNGARMPDLGERARRRFSNISMRGYVLKMTNGKPVPLRRKLDLFQRINTQSAATLPIDFLKLIGQD